MLHGEIKVNDTVIGEWKAIRRSADLREFGEYDCIVTYRDMQGYPCEAKWTMYGHYRGDGAMSLAGKVMTQAIAKLQRVNRTADEDAVWLMNQRING